MRQPHNRWFFVLVFNFGEEKPISEGCLLEVFSFYPSLSLGVYRGRYCTKENEDTSFLILIKTLCKTSALGYTQNMHTI